MPTTRRTCWSASTCARPTCSASPVCQVTYSCPLVPPPSCPLVSHVLVTSGAKEDDYEAEEEPSRARTEEPTPTESSSTKKDAEESRKEAEEAGQEERRVSDIGSISFVSCATGEDAMTSLGGKQETEEGINYCHKYFCSCFFCICFFLFFYLSFQRERQD